MQETFTNKNSKIQLNGYKAVHSYRRLQNKRAKRSSGGLIIYIREQYQKGVKIVKNDIDCLIWLKFDKNFFQIQNDIYLAVTYIAPENSPVHSVYEIDIFQKLQLDISYHKEKGKVFVCGDLNCRTASRGVPAYTQSTQLRTLIFECPKKYKRLKTRKCNKNLPHPG